jgi:hypothetical protein
MLPRGDTRKNLVEQHLLAYCEPTNELLGIALDLALPVDLMWSWLKALVVLAALAGGLPSAAWAHAGHGHAIQATVRHDADVVPQGSSASSFARRELVAASAVERSNNVRSGAVLPCCCQGAGASCASSSGGTLFGLQVPTTWDLEALARLSSLIRGPKERGDYAAPHHRLDRPPKV